MHSNISLSTRQSFLFFLLTILSLAQAWVSPSSSRLLRTQVVTTLSSSTIINSNPPATSADDEDDDDDDEYEYVEYEMLTEPEFLGSEWLVGTCDDKSPDRIDETWVRLATDKDGKNVAIWGDNSEGTWNFDTANQFLSMSKENLLGKKIWAGVVEDYYFTQGTVRGWNFLSPAAVLGQWQAKRLGVDPEEAGVAPWFEQEEEEEDKTGETEQDQSEP